MRGINKILITCRILNKSIPIGADIAWVSVMTRIFTINTIVARGKAGIKDSMAFALPRLLVQAFMALEQPALAFVLLKPLDLAILPEPLLLVFALPRLLVQAFMALEQPALVLVNLRPLVRAFVNRGQLLMMRKKSSTSSPAGAKSQIAQPERSGIILTAISRSLLFDQLTRLN
jgi:hypothetical protein